MNTTDILIYVDIFMDVLLIGFFVWTVHKVDKAFRVSGKIKITGKDLANDMNTNHKN
jgi:hypothetical protein